MPLKSIFVVGGDGTCNVSWYGLRTNTKVVVSSQLLRFSCPIANSSANCYNSWFPTTVYYSRPEHPAVPVKSWLFPWIYGFHTSRKKKTRSLLGPPRTFEKNKILFYWSLTVVRQKNIYHEHWKLTLSSPSINIFLHTFSSENICWIP